MALEKAETFKVNDIHDILVRVHFEDPQEVAKPETGRQIGKQIYEKQWKGDSQNFFSGRAAHQRKLELWSLGKQDVQEFLPAMGVSDATKAEVSIDTTPSMVASFFTDTLVEYLSKNVEVPVVKAVDDISQEEKINRYWEAIFRMENIDVISDLHKNFGVQLEQTDAYVPDTKLSAQVFFQQKDQLPKEVRFNKLLKNVLLENDYERVLKPYLIRSNIVFNIEAAKITRGFEKYEYNIRPAVYANIFYNFFKSDNGKPELYYIGEGYGIKVKDIRQKYGKTVDNPQGLLSEKDIFELARLSAQNNANTANNFNFRWGAEFDSFAGRTPWDDCTVFIIDYEIMVGESEYWVSSKDSYGNENIISKKGIPKISSDKSKLIKKDKNCVYSGIYCPYNDKILSWVKTGDKFSWKINIPRNNGEYIPSLMERGMAKFKELQLIELKKRHFIGQLSPAIFDVDVERLKNITIGGKRYGWEDIVRIRTLTGANLFSSRGLDPLDRNDTPAIRTAMQDPTLQRIMELDVVEKGLISSLREILGLPIYLDGSSVGQRTAGKLAEGQREASSNVTGFITNSHNQLMEEILNHICEMAWEDVVTEEKEDAQDLVNTKFKVYVKMKMTDYEMQRLESDIERWSQMPDENGKPLISPADAVAIRQIDDMLLAEMYLADKVAENEKKAQKDKAAREQATMKAQQDSNNQAAEKAIQLQKDKLAQEKELEEFKATKVKEEKILDIYGMIASKGLPIPPFIDALTKQLYPNISIPLEQENKQMQQAVIAQAQQEQMQQQQAEIEQQEQEQASQQNPQEEMQEQQQPEMQQ